MNIEAMKQALEALELVPHMSNKDDHDYYAKAINALRAAIQQAAESEPVAWIYQNENLVWERFENIDGSCNEYTPLYTHPAPGVPDGDELLTGPQKLQQINKRFMSKLAKALDDAAIAKAGGEA